MKVPRAPRSKKLVVVIEDDPLVLEATSGLLRSWGCHVVAANSRDSAMKMLSEIGKRPDVIVCDYRLPCGTTGVDAIETLRSAFEIPALLISGDIRSPPSQLSPGGYHLLHKPVDAESFRAALIKAFQR